MMSVVVINPALQYAENLPCFPSEDGAATVSMSCPKVHILTIERAASS
jgi:hypothetical protein